MPQLTLTTGKAPADLSEALGLGELAEKHGDKLIPARIALAMAFGSMFYDQFMEFPAIKQGDQLTEKARTSYHVQAPPCGFCRDSNSDYPQGGFFQ
jgi:hypothetical protein